jgi:diadenosine tetraphosphate (Ap4A) HIT family hydrolase
LRGENPTVLARLGSSFAVIGDIQFLPGYCVLLSDDPTADRLGDLPRERRLGFLADMDLLGQAVHQVCARRDPEFRRVNYAVLGNLDTFLHAHIHARYDWESPEYISGPVPCYPAAERNAPEHLLGPQHNDLRAELAAELEQLSGL